MKYKSKLINKFIKKFGGRIVIHKKKYYWNNEDNDELFPLSRSWIIEMLNDKCENNSIYVGIAKFGNAGRLGNQIFQYAFLYGLYEKYKYNIFLPKNNCQFWNCFNIKNTPIYQENIIFLNYKNEKNGSCNFDEDLTRDIKINTSFKGYFQCYKYFDEYKENFINSLEFKENIKEEGDELITKYGNDCVSIHVRRGDYLNNISLWGDLIEKNYYKMSLDLIPKDKNILIFSDDIDYVKNYFSQFNIKFHVIEKNEYVSLYLMSKCKYHIIANSSFSWMGAYLSKNENIICPDQWWPKEHKFPNNIQKDITKPNWTKIKVF